MRRTLASALGVAVLGLGGCASTPGSEAEPPPPSPDWRYDAARSASRAAGAAGSAARASWRAARAAGDQMGTAAHGLRHGFEQAGASADFGSAPRNYAPLIRSHFTRVLRVPEDASLRIGRPARGYMNHGLLRGGGVAWRGYLVDVEVRQRAALFGDEQRSQRYVARLRDGEVIDVHKGAEHEFLGVVE